MEEKQAQFLVQTNKFTSNKFAETPKSTRNRVKLLNIIIRIKVVS